MRDYAVHVVHTLKQDGYITALAGVEHTAPEPTTIGYDETLSTLNTNYPGLMDTAEPVEAATKFPARCHMRPVFLSFGLNATHRPFPLANSARHPAEDTRYCAPPPTLPDTPETRADMADFKALVREMDGAYDAVLDTLGRCGLAENTLVCRFTDHGLQFPRHTCNLLDTGIGAYLLLRGPGFTGEHVVEELVSLLDLATTVFHTAGIPAPGLAQGRSLFPLMSSVPAAIHDAAYTDSNYHAAYETMRLIRTARYKCVRRYDGRQRPVLLNMDDNVIKALLLDRGWADQAQRQELLYDLVFDPLEADNLIDDLRLVGVLANLRARLDAWMLSTRDSLCTIGMVRAPVGAVVNDPDGTSPNDPLKPA